MYLYAEFAFQFPSWHSVILEHLVRGQVSTGRLQGGARAARLHPLVGIISVGSFSLSLSLTHVVSAPFNLTHVRSQAQARVRECPVLWAAQTMAAFKAARN